MDCTPEEIRVLGCLVEKQLTTPQQYPLTLNSLMLACNQSTSRHPVVSYDEATVEQAVTSAKSRGLTRFVHPSHGRSALRFRHELAAVLALDDRQLALLAVLMLRGPQTIGELRSRTDRMAGFSSTEEVEAEVAALARREEPLVRRYPRAPGQKEERFAHCLGTEAPAPEAADELTAPGDLSDTELDRRAGPLPTAAPETPAALVALAEQLEIVHREVSSLRQEVDDLRRQLGG